MHQSHGELVTINKPAINVFVADPTIADVQVPMPNRIYVFGKKPGHTTVYALGKEGGTLAAIGVEVERDTDGAQKSVDAVESSHVVVTSARSGLRNVGSAASPDVGASAQAAVALQLDEKEKLVDDVKIVSSAQVNLRVRIAEVTRTVAKELGINWDSVVSIGGFQVGLFTGRVPLDAATNLLTRTTTGSGSILTGYHSSSTNVNAVIDALAQEGLVTLLAEPSLTAISGQEASFLAGGEFPIPVAQQYGEVSVDFKQYGVSLDFVPTVMSADHISMRVRPEVSELSDQGAIQLSNLKIPAITVRRAETTVELGSGQSFAIAGLLQNNTTTNVSRYPGLGDLPILGPLFRSTSFQRNESELVIIVTPYIVRPVSDPRRLSLPTDGLGPATDLERIFFGKVVGSAHGAATLSGITGPRLAGDAGFELE